MKLKVDHKADALYLSLSRRASEPFRGSVARNYRGLR